MPLLTRPLSCRLAVPVVLALTGCGDTPSETSFTFSVDPTLTPASPSLPGFAPGETRPLARVVDGEGVTADFVADELWLSTDDEAALTALLGRWNGEVLQRLDPAAMGLVGMQTQVLVRIDAASADLDLLAADLSALSEATTGRLRVSSDPALHLIAASASEAADGLLVGLNFVGEGARLRDGTSIEAPTGPAGYDPDVFTWPTHNSGSVQDIGVTSAWRSLDLAGKLTPGSVPLTVIDMGFAPDDDFPSGWSSISNVPFTNAVGTENLLSCGVPCPWHGTNVVGAAMGVADNGFGAAGPAGPIADPVLVFTSYDFFTSITAIAEARFEGASIANMSYSARVPVALSWSVLPFDAATYGYRELNHMLLFAAAGNDGDNVDATSCTPFLGWPCWEKAWHTPCENAGVICVGGLAPDSLDRADGSNYGHEDVDLFAPFTLYVGPDPANPGNVARSISGTSFSAPYAAGVAALIRAANPELSVDSIESLMFRTAHASPDDQVRRIVNAGAAVDEALGTLPPSITIISPDDASERSLNASVSFWARVTDLEDGPDCCELTWTSDLDGELHVGDSFDHTFTTVGTRLITVTAPDSSGLEGRTRFSLDIVNEAPTVTITRPTPNEQLFRGVPYVLRGTSRDINEPGVMLACDDMHWSSSVAGDPSGDDCDLVVTFTTNGSRFLTLTGTDPQGASDSGVVPIVVVDPPVDRPPVVVVTSPSNGAAINVYNPVSLAASATDDHDAPGTLTYRWTVDWVSGGSSGSSVIGTTEDLSWDPFDDVPFDSEGLWTMTLQLRVTDTTGHAGTDTVQVHTILVF